MTKFGDVAAFCNKYGENRLVTFKLNSDPLKEMTGTTFKLFPTTIEYVIRYVDAKKGQTVYYPINQICEIKLMEKNKEKEEKVIFKLKNRLQNRRFNVLFKNENQYKQLYIFIENSDIADDFLDEIISDDLYPGEILDIGYAASLVYPIDVNVVEFIKNLGYNLIENHSKGTFDIGNTTEGYIRGIYPDLPSKSTHDTNGTELSYSGKKKLIENKFDQNLQRFEHPSLPKYSWEVKWAEDIDMKNHIHTATLPGYIKIHIPDSQKFFIEKFQDRWNNFIKRIKTMFEPKTKVEEFELKKISPEAVDVVIKSIAKAVGATVKEKDGKFHIVRYGIAFEATPDKVSKLIVDKIKGKTWNEVVYSNAYNIAKDLHLIKKITLVNPEEAIEDLL